MSKYSAAIQENKQRYLDELFDLLRIPSVSADPAYKDDVFKTADVVAKRLKEAGADNVEICETPGYPVVYGDNQQFWSMVITMFSLQTRLNFGNQDHLSL
jgi:acetylornithine deacetylase/succinyl-diaminopimelate desuccinylase-like protein